LNRVGVVVDLVAQLLRAREEVARIERELDKLLGAPARREASPSVRPRPARPAPAAAEAPPRPPRGDRMAKVVELRNQGLDNGKIANLLGCTKHAVEVAASAARRRGLLSPKAPNGANP
jgi:hypothetical protein